MISTTHPNVVVIDDYMHLRVSHDFEMLQDFLNDKNARGTKQWRYIDEEENATIIIYLQNRPIGN